MEKDISTFSERLVELMDESGIDAGELSEKTNIPMRFITALLQSDFNSLPARPYVRGYLGKISEALDAEYETLWKLYRDSADVRSSGNNDRLPENRFAIRQVSPERILAAALVIAFLGFVVFRWGAILGKPAISVSLPESTSERTLRVSGQIKPGDRLTINGEDVYPSSDGVFEKDVQLEPGLNPFEFRVKRYLGRETVIMKRVFYQPNTFEASGDEPAVESQPSETNI